MVSYEIDLIHNFTFIHTYVLSYKLYIYIFICTVYIYAIVHPLHMLQYILTTAKGIFDKGPAGRWLKRLCVVTQFKSSWSVMQSVTDGGEGERKIEETRKFFSHCGLQISLGLSFFFFFPFFFKRLYQLHFSVFPVPPVMLPYEL